MEPGAALEISVRNAAVLSHGSLNPTHRNQCPCGSTFFSSWSQLTIRRPAEEGPIRATRLPARPGQPAIVQIECYTPTGHFAGTVRLEDEIGLQTTAHWQEILRRLPEASV
jgi:hypothetical protein